MPINKSFLAGGFWYPTSFANAQTCTHLDLAIVKVPIENAGEFEGGGASMIVYGRRP